MDDATFTKIENFLMYIKEWGKKIIAMIRQAFDWKKNTLDETTTAAE